jgi:hypothetical protein
MSRITSPSQGRVPIGYAVIGGQKVEITLNDEWARFFDAVALRLSTASSQISNIQSAVDMASALGSGDGDGGGDSMPSIPGKDGATGATGPALGFLMAEPELPDWLPGTQGPPGAQGIPGPAIYLTQDAVDTETFFIIR